ncbi:MAG: alanine racemase [Canibacter sp.]
MRSGRMRVAEVSVAAIRENVRTLRARTGGNLIAVIKANGYGHGREIVAKAAMDGGATQLGVADLEEALLLRESGIDAPLLCWLHGTDVDFGEALATRIELGVNHLSQLEQVAEARETRRKRGAVQAQAPAVIQFKLDTGLSRNGAGEGEWEELFARAAELERDGAVRVRGVFSHLANAGEESDLEQAAQFDRAIALLHKHGIDPPLKHLAASAATLNRPSLRYNTVRVGMACFGLSPFAGVTSADLGLRPAMRLRAEIVSLREVNAGTGVSYGYNYRAVEDTVLALVPVGYADGMPRALNNSGATVSVHGQHRPIVGRIGMDQCIVDLGRELGARVTLGDKVVLFGDPEQGDPPVEDWADRLHTINYEVVARLGSRLSRVAVDL